jgi:predicted MFS family arabinose efflux permease
LAATTIKEVSPGGVRSLSGGLRFLRRHSLLLLLTATYAIAFVDRQVLAILQESIKRELGLSDSQLGLLTGFSFALFYAILGVPIGRIADRWNRRNLISFSMFFWSAMTALSGYARNFTLLLLTRVGVGVGEAAVTPSSSSIISDTYPPQHRATAMAIYTTGAQIGMLIGFLFGGWLDASVGWRLAFVIAGLPGIVVALLIRLLAKEPVRAVVDTKPLAFWAGARHLAASRTVCLLMLASILSTLVAYSSISWAAPFLIRVYKATSVQAGFWLALSVGLGGILASSGCGLLADFLGRRDQRWYLWLPGIVTAAMVPLLWLALSAESRISACLFFVFPLAFGSMYAGIVISVLHRLSPPQFRATTTALFLLMTNIFGMGPGPWLVGILSDRFSAQYGVLSLQHALLTIVPPLAVLGTVVYFLAARTLRRDLQLAQGVYPPP